MNTETATVSALFRNNPYKSPYLSARAEPRVHRIGGDPFAASRDAGQIAVELTGGIRRGITFAVTIPVCQADFPSVTVLKIL